MKLTVLDIGGTSIKYAKYENGVLENFSECNTEAYEGGPYVIQKVIKIIHGLGTCDGIGISTAGQVDFERGCIRYANDNIPGYTGMEIRKILEEEFEVPVFVENDVNAVAIGEGKFGAARGISDYLCLTYGTGVGGAAVIDGKLLRGSGGSAAEFGSMIIHGEHVNQGGVLEGCYEYYASTSALVQKVQERFPYIANGRQVFEKLEIPAIQMLVDEWIREIAHGLVTLIHIFNPKCVILGGGVMNQAYVVEAVRRRVKECIMPSFCDVEILAASLGNKAGLWGAVYIASGGCVKKRRNEYERQK